MVTSHCLSNGALISGLLQQAHFHLAGLRPADQTDGVRRVEREEEGQELNTVGDGKRKTNNKQKVRRGRRAAEVCLFSILPDLAREP